MIYQRFIPEGWNQKDNKYSIEELRRAQEKNVVLEGKINNIDYQHNVYVDLGNNIKGIIPKQELGQMVKGNSYVQFKINDINEKENVCMLSRKAVKDESLAWIINNLSQGDVVDGIVRSIKPYGAFIEVGGGSSGLLYINDISVARMKSPEERLQVGQRIKVKIKEIDKQNKKFFLSYKDMLGSWEENIKEFEEGSIVKGIAKEITKNKDGIFIELKPNLVGLCDYKKDIEYGKEVLVKIKKIIPEKKKIKLTLVSC